MNIVETNGLTKIYGGKAAVDNVNMHIEEGTIYGFVGENGSGKTTIMRLLTGLAEPNKGEFSLFGINCKDKKIYSCRKQMSAIVETISLVPTMTAIDNMIFQEMYLGIKLTNDERMALLEKVDLGEVGKKRVKNFSLGMRQRLGIALALLNKPKLLLLDEPMNGLDPQGIVELRDLLVSLNKNDGITILISSHILSELEKIATHYGFITHGKLIEEITVEELHERCRKAISFTVNDASKIDKIFNEMKIKDYKVSPNGLIKVYDQVEINPLIINLDKYGLKILSISTSDESIEDYYLNLVRREN